MPGKLRSRWEGPYKVKTMFPFGMIELEKETNGATFRVNGNRKEIKKQRNHVATRTTHCCHRSSPSPPLITFALPSPPLITFALPSSFSFPHCTTHLCSPSLTANLTLSHTNTHHNSPSPAVTNADRHHKLRHQLTLGLSLTTIDYLATNPSLHRYNLGFTPSRRLCVPHPPSQLVVGICAPSPSSVFESLIRGRPAVRRCSSSRPCSLSLEFQRLKAGESLEEAVRRETWEETGIEVGEVVYHSS
ncbi:hypothetical protein PIB30_064758 [Stylosanthes scabra]|uniref:Nudix hydrolase domain-containing protein n=1 Tax=Stylosanthes scabra TaxID=79078 RepID=A0ABU6VKT6_9FABA|nr:hypothetical protein [Stylosanthes scabra]